MGKGGAGYHSSRAEFLSDEALNDGLKYSRNGGCFVTTKKAIAFVVVALGSLICVVLLMYYYGPNKRLELFEKESNDIEQLLNDTLSEKVPEEDLRLPKLIYPINYRLWIHPIIDEYAENNFTFTGRVKILINCTSKTDKIVLNIDDLNITDSDVKVSTTKQVELKFKPLKEETHNVSRRAVDSEDNNNNDSDPSGESTEEPTASTTEDETTVPTTTEESIQTTTEQILIHTEEIPLTIDKIEKDPENFKLTIVMKYLLEENHIYTVDIKFFGEIINNLVGLYKTSYTDLSGKKKWLATTHMQSVYARRVFPCFDEPSFKATFEISVARRTNMTALSNMPLQETEPMNATEGWVWDHFQKSPPMSTYIVAFTVCDFDNLSANPSSGTAIRVWAPKDDVPKTKYALEVTQEILKFLEKYFAMEYPLPKLDMVAVPNFGKEAMENWGLISFRKSSILFDPNSRSIKTKSFIFSKIAHELTHQWFGNLVTMDWWSDLWLNEGFGTFMAEVAVTSLRPLWHSTSTLQLRDMYKTLYFDSLKTTRSIQTQISSTSEIEQIFDTITYQKGSSVLKMLNFTITRPVFKKGLRDYLKKYSYTTATQDDLWEIFTETAHNKTTLPQNVTVKQLMNSWTTQSGYPYLTVFRNYSDQTALLNQTKMVEDTNSTESNSLWFVPVTYITKEDLDVKNVWLGNIRKTELDLNGTSNNSWILLNIDETGFYRVNYDKRNWKLLQAQLRENPNKIPISNRGQLIDDAFQLARIAVINYTVAFDLVKYLNYRETNYIPWYAALRNMEELRVIMSNYEYDGLYDSFLLKLIKPVFDKLSVNEKNLTQTEKLLQLHIFTSACKLRYSKCISWAKDQYRKWMNMSDPDKKNPIPVDYRFIVQCSAIKSSGPDEWDFLWNRTLSPKISPNDLQTAYLSLGCSYDPWIINRYLEYSLDGNITLENVPFVWKSISHPVGVRTGFQFLRLNWDRIFDTYEDIYLVFSTIFHDFVSGLSTEIDLEDLTTFYKLHQNDLKSVSGILQSTVDQMKVKINWKKIHLESVVNWLRQNKY